MQRTPLAALLLLAIALPLAAAKVEATSSPRPKRPQVVVVIVDSVTLLDYLIGSPKDAFGKLLQNGALGLMVTRAARDQSPESTYLTIGCGVRAMAPPIEDNPSLALAAHELWEGRTGASLYRANTGRRMRSAALAQCRIAQMQRDNAQSDYQAVPGRLGSLLAEAGVRVACIGDADSQQALHRPAISLAMDENGLVPMGEVGASLHRLAPELPAGVATDFGKLQQAVDRYLDRADFLVIDTGDTARIAEFADQGSDEQAASQRKAALRRVDRFLRWLLLRLKGERYSLFVITPTSLVLEKNPGYTVTPIIAYGRGFRPGLLTSPSTRQAGVVVNTDLAPTWLAEFRQPVPADLAGRAIAVKRPRDIAIAKRPQGIALLELINDVHGRIYETELHRQAATRTAISLMMMAMALATLAMMLGERLSRWLRWMLGFALGVALALPLMLKLTYSSLLDQIGSLTTLGLLALCVILGAVGGLNLLGWLAAFYTLLLVADMAAGGQLLSGTVFSHSIPSGARYYGIGNELGGFLVAATLIALLGWDTGQAAVSRRRLILIGVGMIVVLALIGLPFFGANFGVMLGGAVGFAMAFARLCGARLTAKTVLVGVLVLAAVVAGVIAVDLLRGAGGSHIGRAFGGGAGGHGGLLVIAGRKLATNWRVFQVSLWSRLLGLAVACLIAAAVWLPPAVKAAYGRHRNLGAIMTGIGWGSLALFLFNDSGVVAAALSLTLGATWLTWCALEQPKQDAVSKPSG